MNEDVQIVLFYTGNRPVITSATYGGEEVEVELVPYDIIG